MKQFRKDLYAFLTANAGISAIVGNRVYPFVAPEGIDDAYIVITQLGTDPEYAHDGRSEDHQESYQFDCVSTSVLEAETLSELLIDALHDAAGTTIGAGSNLSAVELLDNQDGYNSTTERFIKNIDLSFLYKF